MRTPTDNGRGAERPTPHGVRPRPLSPEEKHERLEEGPEVVVLSDLELVLITVLVLHVDADVAKHLRNGRVTTRASPAAPQPVASGRPAPSLRPPDLGATGPLLLGGGCPSGWVPGTHLHPDDGVDEEEHGNQQTDIRQGLAGGKAVKGVLGPSAPPLPSLVPPDPLVGWPHAAPSPASVGPWGSVRWP